MKMGLSVKSLAGPGYIILNTLRAINIICFIAVIVASIVMLVKTSMDSNLFFFDAVSHVITVWVCIFLIVSELSMFRNYFARNWPLLSPVHGFITLGSLMLVIGVDVMGNLNKPATSQKNLGLPFWRIVIGSGILITIFGFVNIVASFIFRDKGLGITARQVRAKGAVALIEQRQQQLQQQKERSERSKTYSSPTSRSPSSSSSYWKQEKTPATVYTVPRPSTPPPPPVTTEPSKNQSNGEKSFLRFPHMGNPFSSRRPPSYQASPNTSPTSRYSTVPQPAMEISGPLNVNTQFQGYSGYGNIARPDSAYHPAARV